MKHRERVEAAISGKAVDRPPVALWRHFPVDDMKPNSLADAHIAWQKQFDFDFLKVTPSSAYFLYDWGLEDEWKGSAEGTREYRKRVFEDPSGWEKLSLHDPQQGSLGGQLAALKRITTELGPDVPVIMTIFSPLGNAKKVVGDENLLAQLDSDPEAVHKGLLLLTEDTINFLGALKETGIAGIFYAIQHASRDLLSAEQYQEFGRGYDLEVLSAASDYWFNLLHLHGDNIQFDEFIDFPVQAINWHDRETPPDLKTGKELFPGAVCGGLRQWDTLLLGSNEAVRAEALEAIRATDGERFILGTGCVTMVSSPYGNVVSARQAVEEK
ncbi:uroporphyrinogen decarboxylase family protein [Chloroflexota bacterium]